MEPGTQEWLDQVDEAPFDPDRAIVDPHHHLWPPGGALAYGVDDLVADTSSGHNIVQTVFIECGAGYRPDGPEHLQPVGESDVRGCGRRRSRGPASECGTDRRHRCPRRPGASGTRRDPRCSRRSVGWTFQGDPRLVGTGASNPRRTSSPVDTAKASPRIRRFVVACSRLGERGLSYDCWLFHHQNVEFAALARAVPGTTMVLDHFGTPRRRRPLRRSSRRDLRTVEARHRRHRRMREHRGEAGWPGDARQRVRIPRRRGSADIG